MPAIKAELKINIEAMVKMLKEMQKNYAKLEDRLERVTKGVEKSEAAQMEIDEKVKKIRDDVARHNY